MHLLAVTMIGSDQRLTTGSQHRFFEFGDTTIERLNGFYGGVKIPGMANHIAVRKVHDNQLVRLIFNAVNNRSGDFFGGHLRL